jgi:hypothetical protein
VNLASALWRDPKYALDMDSLPDTLDPQPLPFELAERGL